MLFHYIFQVRLKGTDQTWRQPYLVHWKTKCLSLPHELRLKELDKGLATMVKYNLEYPYINYVLSYYVDYQLRVDKGKLTTVANF